MFTPNPQCKVCQTIEKKPKLQNEIFKTSYYISGSKITLLDLKKQYVHDFSYDSLRAHVKRHQSLTPTQVKNRNLTAIKKKHEAVIKFEAAKNVDVWGAVIGQGMEKLESGELQMTMTDLLKATKDKSDFELKVKDQEMAMAEMVAHFASGEGDVNESRKYDRRVIEGQTVSDYDPTLESPEDIARRSEQSRTFYQSLVGDATSSGSD
jgi:hypothetical protein